jgi:hypothetical protein
MNKECHTGRELDCPMYSICSYDPKDRLISNCDPLTLEISWGYEARTFSCQYREIELKSLLDK